MTNVVAGVVKAGQDVRGHIKIKEQRSKRELEANKAAEVAAEVKRMQEEAQQKASALKQQQQQTKDETAALVQPIFMVPNPGVPVRRLSLATLETEATENKAIFDKPLLILECDAITLWVADSKVAKCMSQWGKQYAVMNDYRSTGRTQFPMKQGLDETLALMSKMMPSPLADISTIQGVAAFVNTIWQFGYAPGHRHGGFLPNVCACIKILFAGKIEVAKKEIQQQNTAQKNIE